MLKTFNRFVVFLLATLTLFTVGYVSFTVSPIMFQPIPARIDSWISGLPVSSVASAGLLALGVAGLIVARRQKREV